MTAIAAQLEQQYPDTNTKMGVRLEPLHDSFATGRATALLMLSGAVGLLFLIVCANIANLQLGRGVEPGARARDPPRARRRPGAAPAPAADRSRSCSRLPAARSASASRRWPSSALTRSRRRRCRCSPTSQVDRHGAARSRSRLSLVAPVVFGIVPALRTSRSERVTERSETASRDDATAAQPAGRGRGGAVDRARGRRGAAGAQPARLQHVDPGFTSEHASASPITLPSHATRTLRRRFSALRRDRTTPERVARRTGRRRHQHARAARDHAGPATRRSRAARPPTTSATYGTCR